MRLVPLSEAVEVLLKIRKFAQEYEDSLVIEGEYEKADPDWELLALMAADGRLIIIEGDECYSGFIVGKNVLYKDKKEATNIAMFVKGDKGKKCKDMVLFAENLFKGLGFEKVMYMLPESTLGRYFGINGYKKDKILWSKSL